MLFSKYIYSNAFKFKTKYVLPVIASLVTYVVIGQLYTSLLSENDLVSLSGQVSIIKQDIFLHDKGENATKRVSIELANVKDNFFLFDNTGDIYELLKQDVSKGDTVSILHRTQLQSLIGLGSEYQVMKLAKDEDVLYSFDEAKQTFGTITFFGIFIMSGLWVLYFYLKHILKQQKM